MNEEVAVLAKRLIDYSTKIVKGDIIASKKHIQSAKRFLDDLERSQNDDFPYEFDIMEVYRVYEWAKLFKHSKALTNDMSGKPIELVDFQLFIVGNIFGWKHKKTGYRRYKKSYIQLARKQAKSQLLSIICSYEAFNSGDKGEVYIAGWGREQSGFVYKEIETQLKNCPFLKDKWSNSYHRITHLKSESIILALSRDGKTLDGTNPSFVVIDEYHVHKTDEIYQVMESGMVRPNAHIAVITTAGFELNTPCHKTYEYVSKILDPNNPIDNDEYFVLICELDEDDDIKDEKTWIKANPLLASFEEGMDILRGKLKIALDFPDKMRDFLTKNCNKWVQMRKAGYIPLDKWKLCEETYDLERFRGYPCIIGIDLSSKIDLTSLTFLFKDDEDLYLYNHSFLPSETLIRKMKTDKVPYDRWINSGWLTSIDGDVVDYRYVEKYIEDAVAEYNLNVQEVCIDAWNDPYFISSLSEKGYVCVEVRQGIQSLGTGTKNFRDRVYAKTIKHNGNELFSWSVGNAITKSDINENIMLNKQKSTERIDPIASAINAMVRAVTLEGDPTDLNDHILSEEFSF